MKDYPPIPGSTGQQFTEIPEAYIFDKLDGRQVRIEWTKKRGFAKWGSRHQLVDIKHDPEYWPAQFEFELQFSNKLSQIFHDHHWQKVTCFLELWQEHSLGGVFVKDELYHLVLFDVAPDRECMMGPREFVNTFANLVPIPRCLGMSHWTRGFVQQVRDGALMGVTFEGVVAKAGERHKQVRAKAKTQKWIDAILARYGEVEGRKIVES